MTITIGNKKIGKIYPPFIIAEMSGNHNQSLDRALAIIEAAAKAEVHAVKLQTYTAFWDVYKFVLNDIKNRIIW
jgi:N-acetylneuraminate synthase